MEWAFVGHPRPITLPQCFILKAIICHVRVYLVLG